MTSDKTQSPAEQLRDLIDRNRQGQVVGVYSVCSAHPWVLEAAMRQAQEDGSLLCLESTSNQVNQEGGYTGYTPLQFVQYLHTIARRTQFSTDRLLLGGDHLGPYPWRAESAASALQKARALVQSCVSAGYVKIHLDASMACVDDGARHLTDPVVSERAAELCKAAEESSRERPSGSPALLYVIGTEVPAPGGETVEGQPPRPTTVDQVEKTLECFKAAFLARGLKEAWERVIALVVQPGVEFGDTIVFDYDRKVAEPLSRGLPSVPALVYEAHSTDYQKASALRDMVGDHFAILKVGPWLTFAFREAVFALSAVEREWLGARRGTNLSKVREALEAAMIRNPSHWKSYYPPQEPEAQFARKYSFSDRCRYYWPDPSVQKELEVLIANLSASEIPLTLLSQFLPQQYESVRAGEVANSPKDLIANRIRQVLRVYSAACGNF
jgi:D-tagatose-1,6-bisphosphate aldolase subunit GatZ/KbaZ